MLLAQNQFMSGEVSHSFHFSERRGSRSKQFFLRTTVCTYCINVHTIYRYKKLYSEICAYILVEKAQRNVGKCDLREVLHTLIRGGTVPYTCTYFRHTCVAHVYRYSQSCMEVTPVKRQVIDGSKQKEGGERSIENGCQEGSRALTRTYWK